MITAALQRGWNDISSYLGITLIMFVAYATAVSILPLNQDLYPFADVSGSYSLFTRTRLFCHVTAIFQVIGAVILWEMLFFESQFHFQVE